MAEPATQVERDHILDDLRGILRGEILFDDLSCALYSTDASVFELRPLGVVCPVDEADVEALVEYAAGQQISLTARGAGTGLAGESLGSGLIVDLSRHFRRILEIGEETARIQPGVVLRTLNHELAKVGRRFAPNPALEECTLGGMLATNASGSRAFRYGYTRDHVRSLRAVLSNGRAVPLTDPCGPGEGQLREILPALRILLEENRDLIREHQPRGYYNRCGYLLHDVWTENGINAARLMIGSEGTLGLITEATVRTVPLPLGRAFLLLSFESLERALHAIQTLRPLNPVACDLLDRRLLALTRSARSGIPAAAESLILVELETDSPAEAESELRRLIDRLHQQGASPLHSRLALTPDEIEQMAHVREQVLPSLYQLPGQARAIPFMEDVAVPPDQLREYLDGAQRILQQQEITATFLVHALTGQVHTRPFLDLHRPEDVSRLVALAEEVHLLALKLGGTVSGQHGTGLARTPWVADQYGPLYPVLREIKHLFDPQGIFNPGKIIARESHRAQWPFRYGRSWKEPPTTNGLDVLPLPTEKERTSLWWLREEGNGELDPWNRVMEESHLCNGCGECRTEATVERMCPIFRATHQEAATPRAKANLMRHLLEKGSKGQAISSAEAREVADLCVNCKMCKRECPAQVDIPKLMLEAKAANVARHGLDRADQVLARTESFARLGSAFAPLINAMLANRPIRWLMEKILGISRARRLPTFAYRNFLHRARKRGWTRRPSDWRQPSRLRLAFFVDLFPNYNDPTVAEAVVHTLHHNGIEVYVPPGQRGSGMASLASGDIETAKETVAHNLRIFGELAREGYFVLCSEPTAAVMLQQDSLDLLGPQHVDARVVAEQTVEWTSLVWNLYQQGRLRTDFQRLPFTVGHHVPCHMKALVSQPRGPDVLSLIPDLQVRTIDVSCSGMAGTYGLKAGTYALSLEAGRPMLEELSRPGVLFGSTECSTCRIQMEDGAGKRSLHPAQYLALAYGLMPELSQRLHQPIRRMVL